MTIRTRVATFDDVSGELALTLAKLEMEAAHGVANNDEQIDFVRDLSRMASRKEVRPWKIRGVQAGLLGLACLACGAAIHAGLPLPFHPELPIPLGLALLFFLLAGICLSVSFRRRRRERRWLQLQEASILAGHSILEEG
jgi:hypothetical protein